MKKKIIVIVSLILIAILMIIGIFGVALYMQNQKEKQNVWKKIATPDRIVYRNSDGEYYQFEKETENYNKIINLLKTSVPEYNENGESLTDEDIDKIHENSFIEFDYKTVSKNYIFQLDKENPRLIKLATSGGNVITGEICNYQKIEKLLKKLSENEQPQKLEYKTMLSRAELRVFPYEYRDKFKEINYKIHQVKITNIDEYNEYAKLCNLVFDDEITEDTFNDNVLILTISILPKIDVKVNVGNIKYTYNYLKGVYTSYTAHLLVVNKMVNSDCIYNTDETEIQYKIEGDNLEVEYDKAVDNLDENVFVKDYDKFIEEYRNSTSQITEEQAKEIAEKGFNEAKRICGECDETTQTVKEEKAYANNFFTRKIKNREGDTTYKDLIECYAFTRTDDMDLNGVTIYVDKKLGKIIGGDAFGD